MRRQGSVGRRRKVGLLLLLGLLVCGCQTALKGLTKNLGKWDMLPEEALADPVAAVGGDAVVFLPPSEDVCWCRRQLAAACPEQLAAYYAPVFVQQRIDCASQRYPYPAAYDRIGQARVCRCPNGKLKSYVAGQPTVYVLCNTVCIAGAAHLQLTYTTWYPAHARTKKFDVEAARVDSCVVRVTLDGDNAPLFYETVLACGCYHKVFVERWVEDAALLAYGAPERRKKYCVEHNLKRLINWEIGGLVDEPRDRPRRPVLLLRAGDHRVLGLGSAARLRLPPDAEKHPYTMTPYAELYAVAVDDSDELAAFFDMKHGAKVPGAERWGERLLFGIFGVDSAGQPRADDRILLHFDQARWCDPTNYGKYLRLPPGLFQRVPPH